MTDRDLHDRLDRLEDAVDADPDDADPFGDVVVSWDADADPPVDDTDALVIDFTEVDT